MSATPSPLPTPSSTPGSPLSTPSLSNLSLEPTYSNAPSATASPTLTLSREQGDFHVAPHGAGLGSHALSSAALGHHEKSTRGLEDVKVGKARSRDSTLAPLAANTALSPVTAASSVNGASSTLATPGESRAGTPQLGGPAPSSSDKVHPASKIGKDGKPEKKGMFGKLFGGDKSGASTPNNNSTVGLGVVGGEKMERGDSGNTSASASVAGGAGLVRKQSAGATKAEQKKEKKELKEAKEREARLARQPSENGRDPSTSADRSRDRSRPRAGSHGHKEKEGMGEALNNFMRNKVQRKSSQTSRKSDDGKSDHGGESAHGGSTKGDNESKRGGGSQTGSLGKKYGVCEKVVIGKGATAVVKLAHKWDRSTERLYAVKEFRKRRKNETEKEYVKKLTSEFCISSTLHHQNIVETVDLVQDEQSHWCEVMEYCPGGDLYAAIKKGDMSSKAINSYFRQILSGVAYLHSMGVAHRDIKPENLLLDAKGHVKITDFGVSDVFRMCWEKTTHLSKGLCGSEPYISPEQFEVKEYDARLVDVWACAIVFYCLHFQELPWRVAKQSDPSFGPYAQLYHANSVPAPISNLVPRECRTVIKRMLNPNPAERATVEEVLADPWTQSIEVIPAYE